MKRLMMIAALISSFSISAMATENLWDELEESAVTLDHADEVGDVNEFDFGTYGGRNETCLVGRYGRRGRLKQVYKQNENTYNKACNKAMRICYREVRGNQYCAVIQ